MKYYLQNLLLSNDAGKEETKDMYYRGNQMHFDLEDKAYRINKSECAEFFTYFNSFSIEKWKKYTCVEKVKIEVELKGEGTIDVFGHYIVDNNINKEWIGQYYFKKRRREKIEIEIPNGVQSSVIAFQVVANEDTKLYAGAYTTEIPEEMLNEVNIVLATTTFKKEDYVIKNADMLKHTVFQDEELKEHFRWHIIDNGCTLDKSEVENEFIKVYNNANVGGSGGFAKGMLTVKDASFQTTHVLLMDDDVRFLPESFTRLYKLLSLIKDKYKSYFISGAMLEMSQQNIQHEYVGILDENGQHGPAKQRFDLNLWDAVIRNEKILSDESNYYAGWWYCCVPITTATMSNLPLPFFIRGDDVEYSIRNEAKFITMNGISIWHQGFGNKFSAAMELYQVHRNDLILQAMNPVVHDSKIIERIKILFWEEIYKFNYIGASFLLDSVEDYMKGPEYIESLNGEECMKNKLQQDNKLVDIPQEVQSRLDYSKLHEYIQLTGIRKKFYDHTCNGQKRVNITKKGSYNFIPYGWGYNPEKLCGYETIYAIDTYRNQCVVFRKDNKKFNELSERYEKLFTQYKESYQDVNSSYNQVVKKWTSEKFWEKYLIAQK